MNSPSLVPDGAATPPTDNSRAASPDADGATDESTRAFPNADGVDAMTDAQFLQHVAGEIDTDEPWPHWKALRNRLERMSLALRASTGNADWPHHFIAFIGNGANTRGRFPTNLSELHEDCMEFASRPQPEDRTHG